MISCVGIIICLFTMMGVCTSDSYGERRLNKRRLIPKESNAPPYMDGTAVVGDSVMYVWKNMQHGVILSTSCESYCSHQLHNSILPHLMQDLLTNYDWAHAVPYSWNEPD